MRESIKSGRATSFQQALVKKTVAFVAKYYLKKPDLADLIALKFPTFGSMAVAAMNEVYFLLGLDRGFRLTSVNFEATNHCYFVARTDRLAVRC